MKFDFDRKSYSTQFAVVTFCLKLGFDRYNWTLIEFGVFEHLNRSNTGYYEYLNSNLQLLFNDLI